MERIIQIVVDQGVLTALTNLGNIYRGRYIIIGGDDVWKWEKVPSFKEAL